MGLIVIIGAGGAVAAEQHSVAETVRAGVQHSSVIVSARLLGSRGGGGGATGSARIVEVFKGPSNLKAGKDIVFSWESAKTPNPFALHSDTNALVLFLRQTTNVVTYQDVTGVAYPFVRASEENLKMLRSQLKTFE